MFNDDFLKRAISGTLFVAVVVAGIFIHPLLLLGELVAMQVVGTLEFTRMAGRAGARMNWMMCVAADVLLVGAAYLHSQYGRGGMYPAVILPVLALVIGELFRKKGNPFQNLAFAVFSMVYIGVPMALLLYLPYIHTGLWQPDYIFLPFLLVWINDTFAYLAGVGFGKHRMFPRISPKKTWEGTVGGGVMTVAAAMLLSPTFEQTTVAEMGGMAVVAVVFGTFGDLLESMLKRSVAVKDAGTLMPGHGGLLDRMDSVLLVIPALFFYLKMTKLF